MKKLVILLLTVMILVSCTDTNEEETKMDKALNTSVIYDGSVTLTLPEVAIPYHEKAEKYLSKENGKVHYYYDRKITNPGVDTVIEWDCAHTDVEWFAVEYGLNEDFSNSIKLETSDTRVAINNLYKDSLYHVRVTAICKSKSFGATGTFRTTDVGPRVMTVDGIYNVRDIGGYKTDEGKTTLQGMIYRGGQMDGTYVDEPVNITEKGIDTMINVMKIRHDMDLRGEAEQNLPVISPLPGVSIKRYGFAGYNTEVDTEGGKENLRAVFSALANPDNYPVYIHCQGGADRTGVLCFMINALLGVDTADLIHDYEFTTFSLYGTRSVTTGGYIPYQDKIRELINRFDGESVKEKVENLLLYVGVTPEEIESIRKIMIP